MDDIIYFDQPLVKKAKAALLTALDRLDREVEAGTLPPETVLGSMFRTIEFLQTTMRVKEFEPLKERILTSLYKLKDLAQVQLAKA